MSMVEISPKLPLRMKIARSLFALRSGDSGQYWLYRWFRRLHLLDGTGTFKFFDDVIEVPFEVPETLFIWDFSTFQGLREINFSNHVIRHLGPSATLIDCGAAFGQVSCRLAKLCQNIEKIIAVEPNEFHHAILTRNIERLRLSSFEIVKSAVSDFFGHASLVFPNGPKDTHSAYIEENQNGNIDVVNIDSLVPDPSGLDIALKLDIEGSELRAIRGGRETIRAARRICFFIELHPVVLRRVGIEGRTILSAINEIRKTRWYLADAPTTELVLDADFTNRLGNRAVDVIGVSDDVL